MNYDRSCLIGLQTRLALAGQPQIDGNNGARAARQAHPAVSCATGGSVARLASVIHSTRSLVWTSAAVEPQREWTASARKKGFLMRDEGRVTGGLDSARGDGHPRSRPGRQSFHGYRARDGSRLPTYAALDLGTNNCRLLVARPAGDSFRVIDAFSRIIRLGEGVSKSGRISDAAIERAVGALAVCRDKMRARGVTRARLIATEACRAAENGDAFRARVAEEVGLELEVIDRQTEATLAATGCTPLMDPG